MSMRRGCGGLFGGSWWGSECSIEGRLVAHLSRFAFGLRFSPLDCAQGRVVRRFQRRVLGRGAEALLYLKCKKCKCKCYRRSFDFALRAALRMDTQRGKSSSGCWWASSEYRDSSLRSE